MFVKVTAKRQVTFPKSVLDELQVAPGDKLELRESPQGFLLRPMRIDHDRLAPLRDKIRQDAPTFDIDAFREQIHDPSLRD